MADFCSCDEWANLEPTHAELFYQDETYGWVLVHLKLTKEKGYTQLHRYGIPICHCPLCGQKLLNNPLGVRNDNE